MEFVLFKKLAGLEGAELWALLAVDTWPEALEASSERFRSLRREGDLLLPVPGPRDRSRARGVPGPVVPAVPRAPRGRVLTSYPASHGLMSATPVASKSERLRVTTVSPCTSAVAAMYLSRSGLGSGT